MANYWCKKFSFTTYWLARVYRLRTGGQKDDKHDNSSTVTLVRSAKNLNTETYNQRREGAVTDISHFQKNIVAHYLANCNDVHNLGMKQ